MKEMTLTTKSPKYTCSWCDASFNYPETFTTQDGCKHAICPMCGNAVFIGMVNENENCSTK